MNAIETLKHEHRVIEKVLGAIETSTDKVAVGGAVDPGFFRRAIDFVRNFADKCHHSKEEGVLFKAMAAAGVAVEGGPIGVMLSEHDEARRLIREAAASLDEDDLKTAAARLADYAALLRQHIRKEDGILYVMAERVLPAEETRGIGDRFEKIERDEMGEGTHERYHEMAHELADEQATEPTHEHVCG